MINIQDIVECPVCKTVLQIEDDQKRCSSKFYSLDSETNIESHFYINGNRVNFRTTERDDPSFHVNFSCGDKSANVVEVYQPNGKRFSMKKEFFSLQEFIEFAYLTTDSFLFL